MQHVVKHDLSRDTARKVAEHAFHSYRQQYAKYNPTLTWVSENRARASFSVKGMMLTGTIDLLPNAIAFDLDVPFVFRVFKSRAIGIIERELKAWTAKAESGEI